MKSATFASKMKCFITVEKANIYLCRNECHPVELRSADAGCLLMAAESVAKPNLCHMCPDASSMPLFIGVLEIKPLKLPVTSLGQNIPQKRGSVSTGRDESTVPIAGVSVSVRGSAAFCVVLNFEACEV